MSNEITAFFKGRVGVCESVYQYDYGIVIVLDGVSFDTVFDAYFDCNNDETAIPVIGRINRVPVPDSCLLNSGTVTLHIPYHTGVNDSEVEYVVTFKVIGRAAPIYEGLPKESTAIAKALAVLQNIQGDVSTWLDEHPEATTTVQDHSLTYEKFVNGTLGYVTPEMFGAVGDGLIDDTEAVSEAFTYEKVLCTGSYKVTSEITVRSEHILGSGSFVYAGESYLEKLFNFVGQKHIEVTGLKVNGSNLVGKCFNMDDGTTRETVVFKRNEIINLCGGTYPTTAIKVEDISNSIVVADNIIRNVRNNNSSVVVIEGIGVIQLDGTCDILNNTIENVITASTQDSDAIKVFTRYNGTSTEDASSIRIANNVVKNCNGRGVKIQGANTCVEDNYFYINGIAVTNRPVMIETQRDGIVIRNNNFYISNLTITQSKIAIVRQSIGLSYRNVRAINTEISGNSVFADASCLSFLYMDLEIVEYPVSITINDNYIYTPNCYPFRLIASSVNANISIKIENNMIYADPWINLLNDLASTDASIYPVIAEKVSIAIKNNVNLNGLTKLFQNTYLSIYKLNIQGNVNVNEQIYGYGWVLSNLGNTRCYFDSDGLNADGKLIGLPSGMDSKYSKGVLVEGITQQERFCVVRLSYISNTAPFENVVVARVYKA